MKTLVQKYFPITRIVEKRPKNLNNASIFYYKTYTQQGIIVCEIKANKNPDRNKMNASDLTTFRVKILPRLVVNTITETLKVHMLKGV